MAVTKSDLKWRVFLVAATLMLIFAFMVWWEWSSSQSSSVRFFFSSPTAVARSAAERWRSGELPKDFWWSAKATVLGLLIGAIIGAATGSVGLLLTRVKPIVRSLVAALTALPILAVSPMFLVWFGTDLELKIAIGAILSGLVFAANVLGVDDLVDPSWGEYLRGSRIPKIPTLAKVVLPLGTEQVLAGFPAAANAAFLGVFVGEFVAADHGLGYRILKEGGTFKIDVVLAETVAALVLLLGLQIIVHLLRTLVVWVVQRLSIDPLCRTPIIVFGRTIGV
ncbi:ABC transporter permease [Phenylobacterium sp.]|uniref:ABC transporter permease n=1 Tax=Phenylobacterium sp. TaxID=1871053 RepID=UPI002F40AEAD